MTDDKPKFTPGPWHKSTFEDDYAIRGAKCDRVIARPNCNFDDAAANAALIAQSPSLYENEEDKLVHLKTLRNHVLSLTGRIPPIPMVTPEFTLKYIDEIIDDTEQLLAKCRGEEQ